MNTQDIQSIINDVMTAKVSKFSDAQLVGFEKTRNPTDELRARLSNASRRWRETVNLSPDMVHKIRQDFYLSEFPDDIKTLCGKYKICKTSLVCILKNQRYISDVWDYPDFTTRIKEIRNINKHRMFAQTKKRKFTDEQIHEIREKFYTDEPRPTIKSLSISYGISVPPMMRILKNESYKVAVWNYPDYKNFILQNQK